MADTATIFSCPMHPEIRQSHPGRCPKCGMRLVKANEAQVHPTHNSAADQNYTPLIIIIALITLVTFALAFRDLLMESFHWQVVLLNFMAGFFLVFSGFKLLDLKGFAEGYSTYDLLAQRLFAYGYVYPFLELGLGILFAMHFAPPFVTVFEILLMLFSGIGVLIKLLKHERFQCACLGTFLKVPLTKVTLVEDFGMVVMGLLMLVAR